MTDLAVTDNDSEIRTIRVTTWLSADEAEAIDRKRGHYNRSSYLRSAGLDREIARAPDPVAREQWADLGRVRGDLTQIARHLNFVAHEDGPAVDVKATIQKLGEINQTLDQLRAWLSGATAATVKAR